MEITLNNVTVGPFKNLNICFFDNKITTIIGPTGSGKSILAEVISTLRKPNEGKLIIDKQIIDLKRDYINYNPGTEASYTSEVGIKQTSTYKTNGPNWSGETQNWDGYKKY